MEGFGCVFFTVFALTVMAVFGVLGCLAYAGIIPAGVLFP